MRKVEEAILTHAMTSGPIELLTKILLQIMLKMRVLTPPFSRGWGEHLERMEEITLLIMRERFHDNHRVRKG